MTEIICVPLIVALTYALIELYKKVVAKQNEILNRIIPIIGLVIGGVAGAVCFYAFPELIIAHNIFSAVVVGASSGLSATGCNQIFKQLKKYGITVTEPNDTSLDESKIENFDVENKSSNAEVEMNNANSNAENSHSKIENFDDENKASNAKNELENKSSNEENSHSKIENNNNSNKENSQLNVDVSTNKNILENKN